MMRALRRWFAVVPIAALVAVTVAALWPTPVEALSTGRVVARDHVTRQLGDHLTGDRADRFALDALRAAGVDPAVLGLVRVDPARGVDVSGAVRAGKLADIDPRLWAEPSNGGGPAIGDLVAYTDPRSGPDPPRIRLGLIVSNGEVAIVDPRASGEVQVLALGILDNRDGQQNPYADASTVEIFRLVGAAWPGGDDLDEAPGHVALSDTDHIAKGMAWFADHPRDTDNGILHEAAKAFGLVVGGAVEGVSWLLDHLVTWTLGALTWVARRLGPSGVPLLALSTALGTTFDGRGLHELFTTVAIGTLLGPLGLLADLGLRALAGTGVPLLSGVAGAVTGAVHWTASEIVSLTTGIDASARVSVASVAVAVASDVLIFAKPFALAGVSRLSRLGASVVAHAPAPIAGVLRGLRAAAGAGWVRLWSRFPLPPGVAMERAITGPGGVVSTAGLLGDAVTGKLSALHRVAQGGLRMSLEPPVLDGVLAAVRQSRGEIAGSAALRLGDLVTLGWRRTSITGDAIGHGADLLEWAARHAPRDPPVATAPGLELPVVGRARQPLPLARTAGRSARALAAPESMAAIRRVAHMSRMHSGANTLGLVASGQGPIAASHQPYPFEPPAARTVGQPRSIPLADGPAPRRKPPLLPGPRAWGGDSTER